MFQGRGSQGIVEKPLARARVDVSTLNLLVNSLGQPAET